MNLNIIMAFAWKDEGERAIEDRRAQFKRGEVESFWDESLETEMKQLQVKLNTKDEGGLVVCKEEDLKRMTGLTAMYRYYHDEKWRYQMYMKQMQAEKLAADAEAAKKQAEPMFTQNLQQFFLDFGIVQNEAAKLKDKKLAKDRMDMFPWSEMTQHLSHQMQCSMLDVIKKQVSKQLVSYSIRKDRRLDEFEDLEFGPNDQTAFDEEKIAKYAQKRYYHDEVDNCMSLMELIRAHIYFTKEFKLTERASYDIFKRFTRRDNTRLGFLVEVAQRSRKPYKLFYEQLLVEFDASHTDVGLRKQIREILRTIQRKPLAEVIANILGIINQQYRDKEDDEFLLLYTTNALSTLREYLDEFYDSEDVTALHTAFNAHVTNVGLMIGTTEHLEMFVQMIVNKFADVAPEFQRSKPSYLHKTQTLSLGEKLTKEELKMMRQMSMGSNAFNPRLYRAAAVEEVAATPQAEGGFQLDLMSAEEVAAFNAQYQPKAQGLQKPERQDAKGKNIPWRKPTSQQVEEGCWKCGCKGHKSFECQLLFDYEHHRDNRPCNTCNAFHEVKDSDNGKCPVPIRLKRLGYQVIMPE